MSGLTQREQQVMDCWETGERPEDIGRQLGLRVDYILTIIRRYRISDHADLAHVAAMEQASARLAAAINSAKRP